jgi:type II secretory pathway pseudopilin PulG
MTTKRFFYAVLASTVALVIAIVAAAVVGKNLLSSQGDKLSDLKAQNQVVEDQKVALSQAKKNMEKYGELNNIAKTIVPQDKDQARTVREINSIADSSGVQLQTISFSASDLGVAKQPTTSATPEGEQATPTPAPAPGSNITQVKPVEGIDGVFALEITIAPAADDGITYQQFLSFLEKLENNRRTAHVDKITVTPQPNGLIGFSLTLNAYIKP